DTLAGTGGGDVIISGDGHNFVMAGMGADQVTTAVGTDMILGDNGLVQYDAEGNNLAFVETYTQPSAGGGTVDLGGIDTIVTTDGDKTIVGGDAADTITMGAGDHTVMGDNGQIVYVAMGQTGAGNILSLETTDTLAGTGGGDVIISGDGNNFVMAGMGADQVTTAVGTDMILGD